MTRQKSGVIWLGFALMVGLSPAVFAQQKDESGRTQTTSEPQKHKSDPSELLHRDHPLVGKIWNAGAGMFVDKQSLLSRLLDGEYILLGETHDNQSHHEHQIWVIKELQNHFHKRKRGAKAAVMFEMITEKQAQQLDKKSRRSLTGLLAVLNKEKTGWKYNVYYKQLFAAVIKAGFPIYPANLDREDIVQIVMKGEDHIPKAIKTTMDANRFNEQQKESLKQEIIESHCNMANDGMVAGMTLAQRVKDAFMSNSLMDNEPKSVKVLIAGSGHVRADRGIPMYVKQRHGDAKLISLAFMEVTDGELAVDYYRERWGEAHLPFDYVWFTPRAQREDPCEAYAKYLKKKHGENTQQETDKQSDSSAQ
ncbi:MAG: ChaN family lipoprotein [Gammaproteobacteria bacterium]|nr:ChaN family lipoprotein [Gammaproteobacteria bacterium]MDH5803018.1 ChaN family lipoprotein [Gammaproteobacteria bacterium]